MSEKETAFWVVTKEFLGKTNNDEDPRQFHIAWIQRTPPLTNLSHEPRDKGWLGTTNDWSECSHGKFSNHEKAVNFIVDVLDGRLYDEAEDPRSNGCDYEEELDDEIWTLCPYDCVWDAEDWLQVLLNNELGITEGMSDEEIDALADKIQKEALDGEAIKLDGLKKCIKERMTSHYY